MKPISLISTLLILCAAMLISACGPTLLDQNWGRSVKSAAYHQTLHPRAGADSTPVEGMEGQDAERGLNTLHQSFTPKQNSSDVTIKVSNGE